MDPLALYLLGELPSDLVLLLSVLPAFVGRLLDFGCLSSFKFSHLFILLSCLLSCILPREELYLSLFCCLARYSVIYNLLMYVFCCYLFSLVLVQVFFFFRLHFRLFGSPFFKVICFLLYLLVLLLFVPNFFYYFSITHIFVPFSLLLPCLHFLCLAYHSLYLFQILLLYTLLGYISGVSLTPFVYWCLYWNLESSEVFEHLFWFTICWLLIYLIGLFIIGKSFLSRLVVFSIQYPIDCLIILLLLAIINYFTQLIGLSHLF